MSRRRTLAPRGSSTIRVIANKTPGARTTAILAVTMSGRKLKPFLVFKGSPTGRIARKMNENGDLVSGIKGCVQKNAWTDEDVMLLFIEKVHALCSFGLTNFRSSGHTCWVAFKEPSLFSTIFRSTRVHESELR